MSSLHSSALCCLISQSIFTRVKIDAASEIICIPASVMHPPSHQKPLPPARTCALAHPLHIRVHLYIPRHICAHTPTRQCAL
ncbi:hypothetical protein FKM82_003730 [Ascaphus truei]